MISSLSFSIIYRYKNQLKPNLFHPFSIKAHFPYKIKNTKIDKWTFTKNHFRFSTWVISIGSVKARIVPWLGLFIYWTCHQDWIGPGGHLTCKIHRLTPPLMYKLAFRFHPSSISNTFLFVDLYYYYSIWIQYQYFRLFLILFIRLIYKFMDLYIKII